MKKYILSFCILFISISSFGQLQKTENRKLRFPAWVFHSKNTDVIGLSLGVLPKDVFKDTTLTRTFGLRIEAPGFGVIAPLMPTSPVSNSKKNYDLKMSESLTEKVYGFNLSSGTFGAMEINGFSGALMIQYIYKMNGLSIACISNLMEKQNGISISVLGNEIYKSNGLMIGGIGNDTHYLNGIQIGINNGVSAKGYGIQIGLFNTAKNFKGLQLGLWNKNDKRSLPILNWNFKS